MLKNLKFIKKIEEFDSKHKYFKWWIVFLVLLPILIIFYLWDNAYISKDIQGDLLYEVYAIKINMFVASLLLLPFYTVSTFKVIKSLQNLINKIHPIIKLIIVVVLIGLIIYLFIEFVYFFLLIQKVTLFYLAIGDIYLEVG